MSKRKYHTDFQKSAPVWTREGWDKYQEDIKFAIKFDNTDELKHLLTHYPQYDMRRINDKCGSLLHFAVQSVSSVEVMDLLLRYGGRDLLMRRDRQQGLHVMHKAVQDAPIEVVELLIKAGGSLEVESNSGKRPICYAARAKRLDVLKILVKAGACLNGVKDTAGETVLFDAVAGGNLGVVAYVLEQGANVNQQNFIGETVVHQCLKDRRVLLLDIFVEYEADLSLKDKYGKSAYDLARTRGALPKLEKVVAEKNRRKRRGIYTPKFRR